MGDVVRAGAERTAGSPGIQSERLTSRRILALGGPPQDLQFSVPALGKASFSDYVADKAAHFARTVHVDGRYKKGRAA